MSATTPCNKLPCSAPYVVQGHYAGDENLYCMTPEEKYILIMECVMACAPDDADPTFYYVTGGPTLCNVGSASYWEPNAFERFTCKCKPPCPQSSGPIG